jgi:hypothetical protein
MTHNIQIDEYIRTTGGGMMIKGTAVTGLCQLYTWSALVGRDQKVEGLNIYGRDGKKPRTNQCSSAPSPTRSTTFNREP